MPYDIRWTKRRGLAPRIVSRLPVVVVGGRGSGSAGPTAGVGVGDPTQRARRLGSSRPRFSSLEAPPSRLRSGFSSGFAAPLELPQAAHMPEPSPQAHFPRGTLSIAGGACTPERPTTLDEALVQLRRDPEHPVQAVTLMSSRSSERVIGKTADAGQKVGPTTPPGLRWNRRGVGGRHRPPQTRPSRRRLRAQAQRSVSTPSSSTRAASSRSTRGTTPITLRRLISSGRPARNAGSS